MTQLATMGPVPHEARGRHHLALEGTLRIDDGAALWKRIDAAIDDTKEGRLTVDLAGVESCDAGVLALLLALQARGTARGVDVQLVGGDGRIGALIDLHAGSEVRPPRRTEGTVEHVGRATAEFFSSVREIIEFLGAMAQSMIGVLRRPSTGNWRDILPIVERSGADALPIVLLINALVGFVMAFQASRQLAAYGANIYVANLVGLSVTRELAPLMTAIIVSGRSGAAFAAELGTMKVTEEIDALRTIGFGPMRHLVLPRAIGLVLVMPVLTLLADMIGIVGGLLVGITTLGLSTRGYMNQTFLAVTAWDVQSGLIKSVVFGATIALIACQQGFATSGGAAGVGRRATSTVVASLFAIVVLDALFTIVFRFFDA